MGGFQWRRHFSGCSPARRVAALGLAIAVLAGVGVVASSAPAGAVTANAFTGVTPARLLDTRNGIGATRFGAGGIAVLPLSGRAGIPPDATAVALNVTATNASTNSFLTVWPSGTARPGTSNLNFGRGETIANSVVVGIGTDGAIGLYNELGTVDVIVDVTGWFSAAFVPSTPTRVMDTRTAAGGVTFNPDQQQGLALAPYAPGGAVGVALNITATNTTATTFVTVWPGGQTRPFSSNLNAATRQTIANAAVVGLGGDLAIGLYNAAGRVDLIVDVMGWFTSGFNPITPTRVMDSRISQCGAVLDPTESRTVQILGANGLPVTGATGAALNVTAVGAANSTFLTVWPNGGRPNASNINADPSETIPNLILVGLSPNGTVELYNDVGPVQVVVDVTALFTGDGPSGAVAGCSIRKPATAPNPPPSGSGAYGPGTYRVGQTLPAGRYTAPATSGCYWERLSGFGGTFQEILANDFTNGRVVVDIKATDVGFNWGSRCATLRGYQPPALPAAAFGEGDYVVGKDIVPGLYQASGPPQDCYWARLSDFTGDFKTIIANDFGGSTLVQITGTDAGFTSSRCGSWTRIG